jgi:hypothetical protein
VSDIPARYRLIRSGLAGANGSWFACTEQFLKK